MSAPTQVVMANGPVLLIGGAPDVSVDLAQLAKGATAVVAADSGAGHALSAGVVPDTVIGDMDSISAEVEAAVPTAALHPIDDQDSTDFDKCLSRIDAPLVLAVGFTGGRLDHTLAVCSALARHPVRRCIVIGAADVTTLAPPRIALPLDQGTRVSLFPLAPVTGESTGLHWPIGGMAFAPDGTIATSNRATGPVDLAIAGPSMLLILPRDCRDLLIGALSAAPAWPTM